MADEDFVAALLMLGSDRNLPKNSVPAGVGGRHPSGGLAMEDIKKWYHLPLEDAAKVLRSCPTTVKMICRQHGIRRWPQRLIFSLKKLEEQVRSLPMPEEERDQALEEINAARSTLSLSKNLRDLRQKLFKLEHRKRKKAAPK